MKLVKGIILAGGSGTRLAERLGHVKLFAKIGPASLICFPILALEHAGIGEIYVVAPRYRIDNIVHAARECSSTSTVIGLESWRWMYGSGYTLLDALETLGPGRYVVSVGDHIYEPTIPGRLIDECLDSFCVAGDRNPLFVDLDEATKIVAREGRVVSIGKDLRVFTHIDTGVHFINNYIYINKLLVTYLNLNLVKKINILYNYLKLVDITGSRWIDVDRPGDLDLVEKGPARHFVNSLLSLYGLAGGGGSD